MALQEVRVRPVSPALLESVIGPEQRLGSRPLLPVCANGCRSPAYSTSTRPPAAAAWRRCSRPCCLRRVASASTRVGSSSRAMRSSSPSPSVSTTTSTGRRVTAVHWAGRSARVRGHARVRTPASWSTSSSLRTSSCCTIPRRPDSLRARGGGHHGRMAVPRRARHPERVLPRGMELPAPVPRGRRTPDVFSCRQFAAAWMARGSTVRHPAFDRSLLSQERGDERVRRGALAPACRPPRGADGEAPATFSRRDGSRGRISRRVDLLDTGPPPAVDVPDRPPGVALGRAQGHARCDDRRSPSTWARWAALISCSRVLPWTGSPTTWRRPRCWTAVASALADPARPAPATAYTWSAFR